MSVTGHDKKYIFVDDEPTEDIDKYVTEEKDD